MNLFIAYLRESEDYFDCFLLVQQKYPEPISKLKIKYFLIGRSIELSLKSYLVFKNKSAEVLKKNYGHNLEKLLQDALSNGLEKDITINVDQEFISSIDNINEYYKSKQFEYPYKGYKSIVLYNRLIAPIATLQNNLFNFFRNNRKKSI